MKKYSLLLLAFLISALLNAQKTLTKSHNAIQQTVVKMFDALSSRDSVSLKNYCTTDVTLYEYGQAWNIDTLILKAIKLNQAADFKRINTFDFLHTIADKNTAWVTYRLESAITKDGKELILYWLETVILAKERKQWKIKHLHSTRIK